MHWFVLTHVLSFLLDLVATARRSDREEDLELLLLRQQLRIFQRKQAQPVRISRWEKLILAALAVKLTQLTTNGRSRLSHILLLFKPDTVLNWTVDDPRYIEAHTDPTGTAPCRARQ